MHLCCIARMRSVPRYSIHCASVTPDGRGVDGSELDARSGAGATFCRMRGIAARAAPVTSRRPHPRGTASWGGSRQLAKSSTHSGPTKYLVRKQ